MPAFEAPVYTLKGIKIRFGSKQLFEDVELYINRGDKISLVGRNGSGKSTLLKIIAGIIEPDDGENRHVDRTAGNCRRRRPRHRFRR